MASYCCTQLRANHFSFFYFTSQLKKVPTKQLSLQKNSRVQFLMQNVLRKIGEKILNCSSKYDQNPFRREEMLYFIPFSHFIDPLLVFGRKSWAWTSVMSLGSVFTSPTCKLKITLSQWNPFILRLICKCHKWIVC